MLLLLLYQTAAALPLAWLQSITFTPAPAHPGQNEAAGGPAGMAAAAPGVRGPTPLAHAVGLDALACLTALQLDEEAPAKQPPCLRWKFRVRGNHTLEFGCIPQLLQVGPGVGPAFFVLLTFQPALLFVQDNQSSLHTCAISACNQRPVGVSSSAVVSPCLCYVQGGQLVSMRPLACRRTALCRCTCH